MLTFRLTKKARKALGIQDSELSEECGTVFEDWFVDVAIFARRRLFLFTNRASLYGFWAPVGRADVAGLADLFAGHLTATMKADGFSDQEVRAVCQPEFRLGKTNDRSVTSSMNDHVRCSRWYFRPEDGRGEDLPAVNHRLNHTPMGALGPRMGFPVDALASLLRQR